MAIVPLPAIAITGPGSYAIPYPGGGTQPTGQATQWTQLKLENASPYGMTLSLGGTSTYSLPAGIADVFPLSLGPAALGAPMQPVAVATATGLSGSGTLRPSYGQYGDVFPGQYPVALAPQLQANQALTIGTGTAVGGGPGAFTVTLPGWATSVGIWFQNTSANPLTFGNFTVTGVTSGITYYSGYGISQLTYVSPIRFDVIPQVDSQLQIQWASTLELPFTVVAYSEQSNINTPSTSLSVALTDPTPKQPHTLYSVSVPNNTATTVLPVLTGAYVYEIIHLEMSWIAGNATAAGAYYWVGPGGLRFFASAVANASNPGNPQLALAAPWFTAGPLQAFSNFGPTGVAAAMARQVPLAASLA